MLVYLSLGSNLGDRRKNIEKAVTLLGERNFRITNISPIYETSPWGKKDQPQFLNVVLEGETELPPENLLKEIKDIEKKMGRVKKEKWGPRIIDIDILFYNQKIIDTPLLKIPHPYLHRRAFVLIPLSEIAPDFIHPTLNKSVKDILHSLDNKEKVRKYAKVQKDIIVVKGSEGDGNSQFYLNFI